jgi:hypothetical protein
MSLRAISQRWCQNGHYDEVPGSWYGDALGETCRCGARFAFINDVDDTNCDAYGRIVPVEVTPAEPCTCSCGHVHTRTLAVYQIPDGNTPRTYLHTNPDGSQVVTLISQPSP